MMKTSKDFSNLLKARQRSNKRAMSSALRFIFITFGLMVILLRVSRAVEPTAQPVEGSHGAASRWLAVADYHVLEILDLPRPIIDQRPSFCAPDDLPVLGSVAQTRDAETSSTAHPCGQMAATEYKYGRVLNSYDIVSNWILQQQSVGSSVFVPFPTLDELPTIERELLSSLAYVYLGMQSVRGLAQSNSVGADGVPLKRPKSMSSASREGALRQFGKVPLNSVIAGRALLGASLAETLQDRPNRALVYLRELSSRSPVFPEVQEGLVQLPLALRLAGASENALRAYENGYRTLEREAARLDQTIRDVVAGRFESELELLNPCGPCLTWDAVKYIPRTIHHPIVADIVASTEFQEAYRTLRSTRYVLERMAVVRSRDDDYLGMLRWLWGRVSPISAPDDGAKPDQRPQPIGSTRSDSRERNDTLLSSWSEEELDRRVRTLLRKREADSSRAVRLMVAYALEGHKARIGELVLQAKLGRAQVLDEIAENAELQGGKQGK